MTTKTETKAEAPTGGKTPHDGVSYQEQWPANPEPSATAKAWGDYLDAKERGEDVQPPDMAGPTEAPAPAPAKETSK